MDLRCNGNDFRYDSNINVLTNSEEISDTMQLHRWQVEATEMFFEKKHMIANACTGAGKSFFSTEIIKKVREENPDFNILIVAPKIVIIETVWLKELNRAGFGPNQVGVYYGYAHEFSKITITTISSISRLDLRIFDFIIFDEIHNMMSSALMKMVKHDCTYKLGLSASIERPDQKHYEMLSHFGNNIYEYDIATAIKEGIINRFDFHLVGVEIDNPEVREEYDKLVTELKMLLQQHGGFERIMKRKAGDPVKIRCMGIISKRNDLINNYEKKVDIVANIIEKHKEQKILLFSQYNKITRKIYWALKEKVPRSEIIDSQINKKLRDKYLKEFEDSKFNVLLSSRIFEEGYNLPKIDLALFLSSNSTSRQMIQRLGRILRKKEKVSTAYYVYCIDTFEQDYAMRTKKFVEPIAESITEVKI